MPCLRLGLLVLAIVSFANAAVAAATASKPEPCSREAFRVVFDIGHTQSAPGAISARGVPEFLFNLELTQVIVNRLHAAGFASTVSKGRLQEDLAERSRDLNTLKPDLIVSIHHDSVQNRFLKSGLIDGVMRSYSDYAAGYSIFVSHENRRPHESKVFALLLGAAMVERGQRPTMHHAEKIPGEGRPILNAEYGVFRYDRLVVLRMTTAPAILFEAGVIAHPDDELRTRSNDYRVLVADAFVQAVTAFCENPRTPPPSIREAPQALPPAIKSPQPPPPPTGQSLPAPSADTPALQAPDTGE